MYNNFTEEARKILISAKEEMMNLKHPYVGSEHLLLAILKDDNIVSNRLKEYDLDYNRFKSELISIVGIGKTSSECFLYTPLLKRVMENAIYDSKENNNGDVTITHLFSSLLEEGEGVAIRILIGMDIDIDDLYKEFSYKIPNKKKNRKLIIDSLGIDLNKKAINNELDPVIGREEETKRIIEILCRRKKNNPILIGPAGVGKTAIVENLSRMIVSGNVPSVLEGKRIINLDMSTLVAGTKYRGEFEDRVTKVLKELEENDDIILFIDEIHTLVGAGGAEGAIDASNIFKPALARNKIRVIGATTTEEYKKFILSDKALDRRFQKIDIKEPNKDTVRTILMKLKDTYSSYHKVIIKDEIIDYIIDMSEKYIKFRKEPDKSIDILDEVGALVSLKSNKSKDRLYELNNELDRIIKEKKEYLIKKDYDNAFMCKEKEDKILTSINNLEIKLKNKNNIVTKKDVMSVISSKCNIPNYRFKNDTKDIKTLYSHLKNNIIGEDKVIDKLVSIYKKIRFGVCDRCYSIMFTGPIGVGKTEVANLFSSMITNNVIKINGCEYIDHYSIDKIVSDKSIFESIKFNPFSVVVIDEIDKMNTNVLNMIYKILKDNKLNIKEETIYFNNVVFIMINNSINDSIGFSNKSINNLNDSFNVELLDEIVEFNKLDKISIEKIIDKSIKLLKSKYNIKLSIDSNTKKELIRLSNYEEKGAKRINGIVRNYLDNKIIDSILLNKNNKIIS